MKDSAAATVNRASYCRPQVLNFVLILSTRGDHMKDMVDGRAARNEPRLPAPLLPVYRGLPLMLQAPPQPPQAAEKKDENSQPPTQDQARDTSSEDDDTPLVRKKKQKKELVNDDDDEDDEDDDGERAKLEAAMNASKASHLRASYSYLPPHPLAGFLK
eukprot:g2267.t1